MDGQTLDYKTPPTGGASSQRVAGEKQNEVYAAGWLSPAAAAICAAPPASRPTPALAGSSRARASASRKAPRRSTGTAAAAVIYRVESTGREGERHGQHDYAGLGSMGSHRAKQLSPDAGKPALVTKPVSLALTAWDCI